MNNMLANVKYVSDYFQWIARAIFEVDKWGRHSVRTYKVNDDVKEILQETH